MDIHFEDSIAIATEIYRRGVRDERGFISLFVQLAQRSLDAFAQSVRRQEKPEFAELIIDEIVDNRWEDARAVWRCLCAGIILTDGNVSTARTSVFITADGAAVSGDDPEFADVIRDKAERPQ